MTIWHLRDLMEKNKRLRIYSKDVKHLSAPMFDGLHIKDFLSYSEMYPEVFRALPIRKAEILKLPRQYLINVIHTIVGEPFAQWVKQRVDARH